MNPHEIELATTVELRRSGRTSRQIQGRVESGALVRIRHGVYASGEDWSHLKPEGRAVLRARAYELIADQPPVLCGLSAAAAHGLPLFRTNDNRVHVVVDDDQRPGAARDVSRHRHLPDESDVVSISGIACTSLARTVADLARTQPPETAHAAADAAFRAIAWNDSSHTYDREAARSFAKLVAEQNRRFVHGVARADRVIRFADGRADGPGESVSRLYLAQLGFAAPDLQVAVAAPRGGFYWVDFGLDDVGAFGEFDGVGKYTDPAILGGRSTQQALLAEKRREDWIRGTTQRRFARWEMDHLASAKHLRRRLADFSIVPPPGRAKPSLVWGA